MPSLASRSHAARTWKERGLSVAEAGAQAEGKDCKAQEAAGRRFFSKN